MDQNVLITVDCLRSDHMGCYGYGRPTSPNIDALAEEGTVFQNSYANCPGTRWALQSLHTGVPTIRINGIGIPEGYSPLAAHLKQAGFQTAGYVVNGFASREYNFDSGFDEFYSVAETTSDESAIMKVGKRINEFVGDGFIREQILEPTHNLLESYAHNDEAPFQPSHSDEETVSAALKFIRKHQKEPFFLWVHLMDAHTPYGYWPEHLSELRGDTDVEHVINPSKEGKITPGEEPPQEVIDAYDAGIRSADEQVGRLLKAISPEATVIITGDHGEEFGEMGNFHWTSLYSSMTQVPIIVRDQELETGRNETPVQHLDIPLTILYSAGVGTPEEWSGEPLQTVDRDFDESLYFCYSADRIAVRKGVWKYIEDHAGGDRGDIPKMFRRNGAKLFRVPHGGAEQEPVENRNVEEEMKQLVVDYKNRQVEVGNGRIDLKSDDSLEGEVRDNLENLGYL